MLGLALAALHDGAWLGWSTVRTVEAELLVLSVPAVAVSVKANSVSTGVLAGGRTLTVTARDSSVPNVTGARTEVVKKLRLSMTVNAKVDVGPWFVMLNTTGVVRPAGTKVRSEATRTSTLEVTFSPGNRGTLGCPYLRH